MGVVVQPVGCFLGPWKLALKGVWDNSWGDLPGAPRVDFSTTSITVNSARSISTYPPSTPARRPLSKGFNLTALVSCQSFQQPVSSPLYQPLWTLLGSTMAGGLKLIQRPATPPIQPKLDQIFMFITPSDLKKLTHHHQLAWHSSPSWNPSIRLVYSSAQDRFGIRELHSPMANLGDILPVIHPHVSECILGYLDWSYRIFLPCPIMEQDDSLVGVIRFLWWEIPVSSPQVVVDLGASLDPTSKHLLYQWVLGT
ncbi:hypothetical protein DSO57_1034874 [Entomophthora muscae]|uniref:Uncharacterized protein n=1 Tax=Entomophthora muscae TaxID=34485 RepID=A0ACC2REK5_9FUNG|nr:hypothetical protein DSO57_1034874 [Entomophthora muscae]